MNWIKIDNNEVIEGANFYISFAPGNVRPEDPLSVMILGLAEMLTGDMSTSAEGETALCCLAAFPGVTNAFFVLDGDYRKAYEELLPQGLDACLKFYFAQPRSSRSPFTSFVDSLEELVAKIN